MENIELEDIGELIDELKSYKAALKDKGLYEYIGRRGVDIINKVTEEVEPTTIYGNISNEYKEANTFWKKQIQDGCEITFTNLMTNQFGEYVSEFIEYGTGIYSIKGNTTKPDGWTYPTDEEDKNYRKWRNKKSGDLLAFTLGQEPKLVYENSIIVIENSIEQMINEYLEEKRKKK